MSILARLIPNAINTFRQTATQVFQAKSNFHSLMTGFGPSVTPGGLFEVSTRNVIRCHFPRPSERKRVVRHGWKKRMSTPAGRRVLMNRILKGRFVYSH